MIGLDLMGAPGPAKAAPVPQDEVKAPVRVVLSPKGAGSTVFGDPQRGIPSGVVRIVITGGSYWQSDPGFQRDTNNWDDSRGWPPSATLWLTNGTRQTYSRLQSVLVTGGQLRRNVGRWGSWFTRMFAIGANQSHGASTLNAYTDPGTVRAVQQWLASIGGGKAFHSLDGSPLKPDGALGPSTNAAVRKFNSEYRNAPADGQLITDGTLASMGIKPSSTPAQVIVKQDSPARPAPPTDGRPAPGWSQPQPEAIGPAITPDSPAAAPRSRLVLLAGGVVVAVVGAVLIVMARRRAP